MANIVQLKRSSVSGRVPDAGNVEIGEPVVNFADQIIFTKNTTGSVIVIGAGTTSNVTEGSNLYFSNARVNAVISSQTSNAVFTSSTITIFPGHSGNVDYGDLSSATADAFGVSLGSVYDCMEPIGSLVSEDLEVL